MGRDYPEEDRQRFTEANRQAWEEAAPVHARINQARLLESFSQPGHITLDEHCLDRLREIGVEGRSIAHLGCNNGRELLSLKNMGAGHCVGFDASAAFLDQARELAEAAGHTDVEFVATDIYDIPADKQGPYDLVLTTAGVLYWMPNLADFFDVLARLTRPEGHAFIEEIHPVLMMYEERDGDARSYLAYSYFREEPYVDNAGLDYYEGETYDAKPTYSFHHTLSDIMMAAIRAGFALRHFAELGFDIGRLCADLEHVTAKPPMGMTMVWQKA